ncbi:hypothetical protein D3800_07350 [Microcystis aeruginosa NIES-298]|uniref:Uncharacterized protein n=2 Tax=Microcystis aeruginosa TaxID=1126 RepID=A0A2H6BLZ6_MICAE|nr:hypothetical protein [Microcystis aeruginosa]ELP57044.1 hypothetical protein O53_1656 [Microcystis aeruginosa TAIHU98]QHU83153.1 hypothetical protein D3800_07350 [Microcystis aeruginosa NIES-298]GBD51180.1 hypothetical protein BGM30_02730 [Microcystis aeruginosa NIES-298]GBE99847.1 hypothetical protein NIES298_40940 [Microcystis aeruginosa NIES-298]
MDSSSKKTADNDRQGLEMDRDERIIELEKEISDLQKENQELIQKLLIENVTSEVIKKVNSHLNEIISIAQKIGTTLLVITGLVGVGGILGLYSAMEGKAKETVESYLKGNDNQAMKKMIDEKIVPEVVDSINKDPKKVVEITQKIAEILPSKEEFTNNLIAEPKFINNLLGSQQFQAVIQTLIMSTNTSLSPETKYYVVTGSSFTRDDVEEDQEIARNVKLSSKICSSKNPQQPAYLMVVAPPENQDFQLDLNTAKKTLELANTVPLFKQNGAYFIAIKDDLFFQCL